MHLEERTNQIPDGHIDNRIFFKLVEIAFAIMRRKYINYSQVVYLLTGRKGSFKCVHYIFEKFIMHKSVLWEKYLIVILEVKEAGERGERVGIQVSGRAGSTVTISNRQLRFWESAIIIMNGNGNNKIRNLWLHAIFEGQNIVHIFVK